MKKLIKISILVMSMISLVGCMEKFSVIELPQSFKDEGKQIEIRIMTRMSGESRRAKIYNQVLREFEQRYPNVKIIDESVESEKEYNNKIKMSIATGEVPHIFNIQGVEHLGEYIENGLIMDIEPVLKRNYTWGMGFIPEVLDYYRVSGQEGIYGVPMEMGLVGIYYNEELFERAGVDEFPDTWEAFNDAIDQFKTVGITPLAVGAKSTYMVTHLHNNIFYKWLGIDSARALGERELSWMDEEVVRTLGFVNDVDEKGALFPDVELMNDEMAMSAFSNGNVAMFIAGPWAIGQFVNLPIAEQIRFAKFPYFQEKPEYKNHDMYAISAYMINGNLAGLEKTYTIELVKELTSQKVAQRFAEEAQFLMPRKDYDADPDIVTELLTQNIELSKTSEQIACDLFDFEPLPFMQDHIRNSIIGMFMGNTPIDAAREIQQGIQKGEGLRE
ncbi:MAG: ABC transporter substrate-binding protein [Cellulosilyticaceae bacterium]